MSRPSKPISDKFDFPVQMVRLNSPSGKATNIFAVERTDTGEVFDKAFSNKYGLINHTDFVNLVEDGITESKMGKYNRTMVVAQNGARLYATYDFKDMVKKVSKVGDLVGFRMTARNSYDGYTMAGFVSATLSLACTNGMVRSGTEIELMKKHFISLTLDIIHEGILKATTHFDGLIADYGLMANIALDNDMGRRFLGNLVVNKVLTKKSYEAIENRWLAPKAADNNVSRDLWGLYNSFTAEMRDLAGSRWEFADKLNQRGGDVFTNAARNTTYFNSLMTPVTIELD